MKEALDGLSVDMSDKVARPEPGLHGRTGVVHCHDQVVNRVKVRVAQVDSDGPQRETEATRSSTEHNGRLEASRGDGGRQLPARRSVAGRGRARTATGRLGHEQVVHGGQSASAAAVPAALWWNDERQAGRQRAALHHLL